jgi:hypothetical protein
MRGAGRHTFGSSIPSPGNLRSKATAPRPSVDRTSQAWD